MPRQPARAVLIARRKFADDELSIFRFQARWDYGARLASWIAVRVGYQIGGLGSIQHQMRHIDRRRVELCKVLHIEIHEQLVRNCMCLNIKVLFFVFRAIIGP